MNAKQPEALAQECADYATSLRSTINVVKLEGRKPPISFLRAADLFERAAARIAELEALAAGYDAARLEIASLHAQMEAVGAGGMEPLRKSNSVEFDGIKTYHGQLLRAALQEAEAALEVALARILKRDPGHAVNVTSEAKALVIVRSALAESQTNHFRGATKMVQASEPVVLPEPDAVLRFERSTAGKENEMPIVVSCNWLPDGEYKLYTEQQVRAMLAAAPKPPAPSGPALEPVDKSPNLQGQAVDKSPETQGCGPAREPLTPEQLVTCMQLAGFTTWDSRMWELKRQVEAALGITAAQKGGAPK